MGKSGLAQGSDCRWGGIACLGLQIPWTSLALWVVVRAVGKREHTSVVARTWAVNAVEKAATTCEAGTTTHHWGFDVQRAQQVSPAFAIVRLNDVPAGTHGSI